MADLAAVSRLSLVSQIIGTRFDSSQDAVPWLQAAYVIVWNAAPWLFRTVEQTNLAVTASDDTPTMPTDFGRSLSVYDQNGDQLAPLDPDTFDLVYRESKRQGLTDAPEAFKVVNRTLVLGPTPNLTTTFTVSYTRRCVALTSGGTTVVGGMTADTDVPFWDPAHHLVLVPRAAMIGLGLEEDPHGTGLQRDYAEQLDAMISELTPEDVGGETQQFGRDTWGL